MALEESIVIATHYTGKKVGGEVKRGEGENGADGGATALI